MRTILTVFIAIVINGESCGDIPSGSRPLTEIPTAYAAYNYTVEAWMNDSTLPDVNRGSCDESNIFVVVLNPEQFKNVTGFCDADAVSNCSDVCNHKCAIAFWIPYRNNDTLIVLNETVASRPIEAAKAYYHELTHFFDSCSGLKIGAHTDPRLWNLGGTMDVAIDLCRMDYGFATWSEDGIICP